MFLGHILNSRINCANYAPVIFNGVWEEGAGAYSTVAVHTYVPSVCTKNGFRSVSFEMISVLDSYFIHRYIFINIGQVGFRVKSTNYYGSYGPFSTLKNGFHSISFVRISVLD